MPKLVCQNDYLTFSDAAVGSIEAMTQREQECFSEEIVAVYLRTCEFVETIALQSYVHRDDVAKLARLTSGRFSVEVLGHVVCVSAVTIDGIWHWKVERAIIGDAAEMFQRQSLKKSSEQP